MRRAFFVVMLASMPALIGCAALEGVDTGAVVNAVGSAVDLAMEGKRLADADAPLIAKEEGEEDFLSFGETVITTLLGIAGTLKAGQVLRDMPGKKEREGG